jgi:hypothetical protein
MQGCMHDTEVACATAENPEKVHALSGCTGETRRRIGGVRCPQRVEWSNAPCPSSQTGLSGSFGSDGKLAALVLVIWVLRVGDVLRNAKLAGDKLGLLTKKTY